MYVFTAEKNDGFCFKSLEIANSLLTKRSHQDVINASTL